jgi:hypothetical protein
MEHRLRAAPDDSSAATRQAHLRGKLAYLAMLNPAQAAKLSSPA